MKLERRKKCAKEKQEGEEIREGRNEREKEIRLGERREEEEEEYVRVRSERRKKCGKEKHEEEKCKRRIGRKK